MVCAEDVVSYFQSLKSYERIWIMCRLQHSCLPFELRFLGTCLEELGKKDFHELRQAENEANGTAEISASDLRKISNRHVQKKIILYLSLLYSHNYPCSNSLYKILCNFDEVHSILKYETIDDEDDGFEHLLMIYTLAVNHPAFSCEQKQVLHDIFSVVQAEESKRINSRQKLISQNTELSENVNFNDSKVQIQECQQPISTSPENNYPTHPLPNPSHCYSTVPPPFASDLPIPIPEQLSIGLPATNFMRYPFPTATSPQLIPSGWNTALPIVFTTTEHTNTTHTFMSRSFSPSISNTPSRSSSPSGKGRPLSAPFSRSPQMSGNESQQPASLPLSQNNVDNFVEIKDSPNVRINTVTNFTPEQLNRLPDEELALMGMTEESIQQLRCVADKIQTNNDELSPTNKPIQYIDPETDDIKTFIEQSIPTTGLVYTAAMAVSANSPGNAVACSVAHPCQYCLSVQNGNQINGFVSPAAPEICIDHMRMLRLESDAPSRNSNSSNSDTTSSDQSPPNTPMFSQTNYSKRSNKSNSNSEWSNSNVNSNSDERGNAGDSSSEERNTKQPTTYQGRGRVINNRGRSKNSNGFTRGRGNNRRRGESLNGNSEDHRKNQYAVNNDGTTFQFTTHPVTATVTNATYIQPSHYISSYPAFAAAPNSFLRPAYAAFPPSGELLYHQYPHPGTFLPPGPIPYSQIVPPKLSCYNCGSQNHFAHDCAESTMEEASKQGQYRLDYTSVEGTFAEK